MKSILFALLLLLSINSFGQKIPGSTTPDDFVSQMWNTANGYYGTVTYKNLGVQLDTIKGTTGYLYVASWAPKYDSARLKALFGSGTVSLDFSALKAGVLTATITAIPVQSSDGIRWDTVVGSTAKAISAASLTVQSNAVFNLSANYSKYIGLQFTVIDTASVTARCVFKPVRQ